MHYDVKGADNFTEFNLLLHGMTQHVTVLTANNVFKTNVNLYCNLKCIYICI